MRGIKNKKNPIELNKRGIIFISIILMMNIIGVGYGSWNGGLKVQNIISTGSIDPVFVECEIEEEEKEDYEEEELTESSTCLSEEACIDVDSEAINPERFGLMNYEGTEDIETEASYVEISEDKKRMDVFINNAYPGYRAKIKYKIENYGTIPVKCIVTCDSIDGIKVDIKEPEGNIYGFGDCREGTIAIELDKDILEELDKDKEQNARTVRVEEEEAEKEEIVDYEFIIDLAFEQYNISD